MYRICKRILKNPLKALGCRSMKCVEYHAPSDIADAAIKIFHELYVKQHAKSTVLLSEKDFYSWLELRNDNRNKRTRCLSRAEIEKISPNLLFYNIKLYQLQMFKVAQAKATVTQATEEKEEKKEKSDTETWLDQVQLLIDSAGFKISKQDLYFELGHGSYGTVYLVNNLRVTFALKLAHCRKSCDCGSGSTYDDSYCSQCGNSCVRQNTKIYHEIALRKNLGGEILPGIITFARNYNSSTRSLILLSNDAEQYMQKPPALPIHIVMKIPASINMQRKCSSIFIQEYNIPIDVVSIILSLV
jgi:hypothetical protein